MDLAEATYTLIQWQKDAELALSIIVDSGQHQTRTAIRLDGVVWAYKRALSLLHQIGQSQNESRIEGNCKNCSCPTFLTTIDPITQQKYHICWECLMER